MLFKSLSSGANLYTHLSFFLFYFLLVGEAKVTKKNRPKRPTSAFLFLMPQVQLTDKKAEVRTFLRFAAARYSIKFEYDYINLIL
jgi:hypothetical protein